MNAESLLADELAQKTHRLMAASGRLIVHLIDCGREEDLAMARAVAIDLAVTGERFNNRNGSAS